MIRQTHLTLNVSHAQAKAWTDAAKAAGMKPKAWMAKALDAAVKPSAKPAPKPKPKPKAPAK